MEVAQNVFWSDLEFLVEFPEHCLGKYWLHVATPGALPKLFEEQGVPFWGRNLVIVSSYEGEVTRQIIEESVSDYCSRVCASSRKEFEDQMGVLAEWEYEDDEYLPYRYPKPSREELVVSANVLDVSLEPNRSGNENNSVKINAILASSNGSESERYEFEVVTPDELAKRAAKRAFLLTKNMIIVDHLNMELVKGFLQGLVKDLRRRSWDEIVSKLDHYGKRINSPREVDETYLLEGFGSVTPTLEETIPDIASKMVIVHVYRFGDPPKTLLYSDLHSAELDLTRRKVDVNGLSVVTLDGRRLEPVQLDRRIGLQFDKSDRRWPHVVRAMLEDQARFVLGERWQRKQGTPPDLDAVLTMSITELVSIVGAR